MENNGAVFLDRDGVLIEEVNYLSELGQVRLVPGAAEAIGNLNRAHVPVIVVTNQAGVARGYFPEHRVGDVHQYIANLLLERGARIDRYYYCPHHPEATVARYRIDCECRKPKAGMLYQAAADFGLNLGRCYLVGDKVSDLMAGGSAGCQSVLVRTGYGAQVDAASLEQGCNLVHIAADLKAAVRHILPDIVNGANKLASGAA